MCVACGVGCGGLAWEGRGYALQWLDRLQMCMDRLRGAVCVVFHFKSKVLKKCLYPPVSPLWCLVLELSAQLPPPTATPPRALRKDSVKHGQVTLGAGSAHYASTTVINNLQGLAVLVIYPPLRG